MYDIFESGNVINKGKVIDPSFISIARSVKNNQPVISNRIVNQANAVKPTSLLLKIMTSLAIPNDLPDEHLERFIRRRTAAISLSLNLTSINSYGTVHHGEVTANGAESILLVNEQYESREWADLEPITFMYHTNANVNYTIGDGNTTSLYFIKINVTMLVRQYRAWRLQNALGGNVENAAMFLAKHAIKNSIRSYMDISLFNLHYFRVAGIPIDDDARVNGVSIPDISNQLSISNIKIIGGLLGKNTSIGYSLYSTPSFFGGSALDLTKQPNGVSTQQINWFNTAYLLSYVHYGLVLGANAKSTSNTSEYSTMTRELRSFLGSRVIDKQPEPVRSWVTNLISQIMTLIS